MDMSVGSGIRRVMAEVNVVPLIDIFLVLLVIFMIINAMHFAGITSVGLLDTGFGTSR